MPKPESKFVYVRREDLNVVLDRLWIPEERKYKMKLKSIFATLRKLDQATRRKPKGE